MAYINLPSSLQGLFSKIEARLLKLETANRFTAPVVPALSSTPTVTGLASGDPSNPRVGDIWLNTNSNTPKYVDGTGAVTTLGGSSGASVPFGPRYLKTGYNYAPIGLLGQGTSITFTQNQAFAIPFYVPATATATSLIMNVATLNGSLSRFRVGIYTNSSTDDYPNTLVIDAGSIATDTIGGSTGFNFLTISQSLTTGLYWLVAVQQGAGTPAVYGYNNTVSMSQSVMPAGIPSSTTYGYQSWTVTGLSGAFPATWTATKTLGYTAPAVWIGF